VNKKYKYGNRTIETSNTDKVFFKEADITKGDIIEYYRKVSGYILPHIKDRPLNLHRAPDGLGGQDFYQQKAPDYFPSWIKRAKVKKEDGSTIEHAICNNDSTLVYLADQACIALHIWLSRIGDIRKPDKMIFDLDPVDEDGFSSVKKAAKRLKNFLNRLKIEPYIMTTGSKGIHVVISLRPEYDFDDVRGTARKIAEKLSEKYPDELTYHQSKAKRKGRLFLDYLRNSYGQTSVCPYSVRLKEGAPVATPLSWGDLSKSGLDSKSYNIKNIFKRLSRIDDPWQDIYKKKVSLDTLKKVL